VKRRATREKTFGVVSFHPQRGGMVTIDPVPDRADISLHR